MKKYLLFIYLFVFTMMPSFAQTKSEGLRILEELHNLPENYQDNPEVQRMVHQIEQERSKFFIASPEPVKNVGDTTGRNIAEEE